MTKLYILVVLQIQHTTKLAHRHRHQCAPLIPSGFCTPSYPKIIPLPSITWSCVVWVFGHRVLAENVERAFGHWCWPEGYLADN